MPSGSLVRAALTVATISLAFASASCGRTRDARSDTGTADDDAGIAPTTGMGGNGSPDTGPTEVDAGVPGDARAPGDAGVDIGTLVEQVGPVCSSDHWCWENPLPQGNTLNAVFTFSDDDVWAVGVQGTILHWNGKGWTNQHSVDRQITLSSLWGSARNDLWAVGTKAGNLLLNPATSVILHFNGFKWSAVSHPPSSSFSEVTGSSANNVWAVGASAPLRWDGLSWKQTSCPFCCTNCIALGAWTNGPSETWVVGPDNLVAHWNGTTWVQAPGQFDAAWVSTWGSGPNDVWAVGFEGAIGHWNGSRFELVSLGGEHLMSVWGNSPLDVWAVGITGTAIHFDGFGWRATPGTQGPDLYNVSGQGSSLVWAVGRAGRMVRWDGSRWTAVSNGPTGLIGTMAGSGPNDIWLGGQGDVGIQHWDGTGKLSPVLGGPANVVAIFSRAPDEVWAVGDSASSWNGTAWTDMPGSGALYSVWASGPNDVWGGGTNQFGESELKHWDGQAWSASPAPKPEGAITHIAGNGPQDIWVVTTVGEVFHYDGTTWAEIPTGSFSALWGLMTSEGDQAWAVGEGGTVYRLANGAAVPQPTPFSNRLESIFRVGADDYWVAGFGGTIGHFDGNRWTPSESGTDSWLMDVWASGPNDIWAVGFDGAVLHKQK